MSRAKIIPAPQNNRSAFGTSIKNTELSQRETLEEIIVNLATTLGAKKIYKQESARGSYFYEVQLPRLSCFQSASNTILELSREIVKLP
ncbi:hypothetical protein [Pseudomonas sp. RL_15y_Pfl2_60]|uniref:hypothetical protein n=1 Tax=Pseudomonas sp. RL_15y_Pfl2_60 TaxID=3088709 RepID=UPI0030D84C44